MLYLSLLCGDAIERCIRIDIMSALSPIYLHYDISQMIDSARQPEKIIAHLASFVQEFRQYMVLLLTSEPPEKVFLDVWSTDFDSRNHFCRLERT